MEAALVFRTGNKILANESEVGTCYVLPEETALRLRELCVVVVFGPGTTGGGVVVESGPFAQYAGRWATLETVRWQGAHRAHWVGVSGAHLAVRIRIAERILGGAVDVYAGGN